MEFIDSALIDLDYYETMSGEDITDFSDKLIGLINNVTISFEKFCNRKLKSRTFDFDITKPEYNEAYSIFDGVKGSQFYFPTYPVNSITSLYISDILIPAATDYDDLDGYHLYNSRGMIIYHGGFDLGYQRNVKIKWNGGYTSNHEEMEELRFLCFDMVRTIVQNTGSEINQTIKSERIGNYSYTNYSPMELMKYQGLNPNVFASLKKYRKEVL